MEKLADPVGREALLPEVLEDFVAEDVAEAELAMEPLPNPGEVDFEPFDDFESAAPDVLEDAAAEPGADLPVLLAAPEPEVDVVNEPDVVDPALEAEEKVEDFPFSLSLSFSGNLLADGPLEADAFSVFFSAVRSIVTGRLEPVEDEAEEGDVAPVLSDDPEPVPPEEDVPPGDFLSVTIVVPPEPGRFQDCHYTRLFAKR